MDIGIEEMISLGAGFILAFIVLKWKRSDDKKYGEELKTFIDRLFANEEKILAAINDATRATNKVADILENFVGIKAILNKIEQLERRLQNVPEVMEDDSREK